MEHLPIPISHNPNVHLRITHIATQDYDGGSFTGFPARQGWVFTRFLPLDKFEDIDIMHHGQSASLSELQPLLQEWLYFGTLHEVFGEHANASDFIVTEDNGSRFLCTNKMDGALKHWVEHWANPTAPKNVRRLSAIEKCKRIYSHVEILYHALGSVLYLADSGTLLATALLGESLASVMSFMYGRVFNLETPVSMPWSSTFAVCITPYFQAQKWCPNVIARLTAEGWLSLMGLYYCLHLPCPQSTINHEHCSAELCTALTINPHLYETAHTLQGCACSMLALEVQEIGRILKKGKLPLIEIDPHCDLSAIRLRLRDDDAQTPFVAISHVWADGLENVQKSSLPVCSLQEISRLVHKLPRDDSMSDELFPFWIDTICVPVEPVELKQLALTLLREPYARAKHVLVLDNYLRSISSEELDITNIMARLNCSNWIGRLWTLQEGRLAKRVWFQFQDKALESSLLLEEYLKPSFQRNIEAYHRKILADFCGYWSATDTFEHMDPEATDQRGIIYRVRSMLQSRAVSVPSDEALCLFSLAGLDMNRVSSISPSETLRMTAFWQQMTDIPSGLVFSRYPRKLDVAGYRWAPMSFLGTLERRSWAGPARVEQDLTAVPTPQGLLVRMPGYTCTLDLNSLPSFEFLTFRSEGNLYDVYFRLPWHQALDPKAYRGRQVVAILLANPIHDLVRHDPRSTRHDRWAISSRGVLGVLTGDDGPIKRVRCWRHVSVTAQDQAEQLVNDTIAEAVFSDSWSNDGDDTHKSVADRAASLAKLLDRDAVFADAGAKWTLGSSYATPQARVTARIVELAQPTNNYAGHAVRVKDDQQWCVN